MGGRDGIDVGVHLGFGLKTTAEALEVVRVYIQKSKLSAIDMMCFIPSIRSSRPFLAGSSAWG